MLAKELRMKRTHRSGRAMTMASALALVFGGLLALGGCVAVPAGGYAYPYAYSGYYGDTYWAPSLYLSGAYYGAYYGGCCYRPYGWYGRYPYYGYGGRGYYGYGSRPGWGRGYAGPGGRGGGWGGHGGGGGGRH